MRREVAVPVATVWTSAEAPRPEDAAAVADRPDVSGWADSMDADSRLGLHGRTLTQLLLGEPVDIVDERDGWSQVVASRQASSQDPRGYPGWVRTAHLGEPVDRLGGPTAYVVSSVATCRTEGADLALSVGTALWVDEVAGDQAVVSLPDGRHGRLPIPCLRLSDKAEPPAYDVGPVLGTARSFLGLRYLWGGTSAWGLDCSGLVHVAWRTHGVLLPRDAHDQERELERVDLDEVRPGDLYFFARPGQPVYHVGFVTRPVADDGTRWMLHAPEGGGIEDAPMAPHRVDHLVSAARVGTG